MANAKAGKFPRGRRSLYLGIINKIGHPVLQTFDHCLRLVGRPFHHQLNASVIQILDVSNHIMLQGDILRRVTKSNALNLP